MKDALVPFIDYLNAVDGLLEARYGITSNDVDMDAIAGSQDDGWTPLECVQWIAEKRNLERIDAGPYGGIKTCENG